MNRKPVRRSRPTHRSSLLQFVVPPLGGGFGARNAEEFRLKAVLRTIACISCAEATHRRAMLHRRAAYTLVELMVVIAIVAVLAGAVISQMQPNIHDGLLATARVVSADLERARELAVAGGSSYRITFDIDGNSYRLEHTGANPRLDTLPTSPFGDPNDPPTRWTQHLTDLPQLGPQVELFEIHRMTEMPEPVSFVEFGPLGETTQSERTVIWLTSGEGASRRYISISVAPVTGLTSIGGFQAASP